MAYQNEGFDNELLLAAKKGDVEILTRLLLDWAKTKADGVRIATPLMVAAEHGRVACVQLLVPVSDLNAVDENGRTALMLCEGRCRPNSLPEQDRGVCTELVLPGSNPNATDDNGRNALHYACGADGRTKLIETLRSVINPNEKDHNGDTLLMSAIMFESMESVKAIFPHSDTKIKDNIGRTSAMFTRESLSKEVADLIG